MPLSSGRRLGRRLHVLEHTQQVRDTSHHAPFSLLSERLLLSQLLGPTAQCGEKRKREKHTPHTHKHTHTHTAKHHTADKQPQKPGSN